jgi:hypothetical protein
MKRYNNVATITMDELVNILWMKGRAIENSQTFRQVQIGYQVFVFVMASEL